MEDEKIKYLAEEKWSAKLISLNLGKKMMIFRVEQNKFKGNRFALLRKVGETRKSGFK